MVGQARSAKWNGDLSAEWMAHDVELLCDLWHNVHVYTVTEELLAAVAGIMATSEDGTPAHLELLLLPFSHRAHAPLSLTGLLAPFENGHGGLRDFKLTSWRYLDLPPAERLVPRTLRKLRIARGLMVYEGLR